MAVVDHERAREHYAAEWRLDHYRSLLIEARAALTADYCGTPNSLAGRIDEAIHGPASPPLPSAPTRDVPLPGLQDLVLESYGDGFAWFRS